MPPLRWPVTAPMPAPKAAPTPKPIPGKIAARAPMASRHIDALNMQMLVQLVESALLDAGVQIARERRPPAIAFLDLSGFTRLTDDAGDEQAVSSPRGFPTSSGRRPCSSAASPSSCWEMG